LWHPHVPFSFQRHQLNDTKDHLAMLPSQTKELPGELALDEAQNSFGDRHRISRFRRAGQAARQTTRDGVGISGWDVVLID
jgi:hypothetical protein